LIKVHAASVKPIDWRLMEGAPYVFRVLFQLRKPTPAEKWSWIWDLATKPDSALHAEVSPHPTIPDESSATRKVSGFHGGISPVKSAFHQQLTVSASAFVGTNPTGELITSGLSVIH